MKKFKGIVVGILLASTLFCTGCSHNEIPDGTQSFSNVDDPLNAPVESGVSTTGTLTIASYGTHFSENDVSFTDGILTITPTLMGGENGTSAGIVILVDGIPQEYSADGSPNKTTMSTFEIKAESEEKHTLIIDAKIDSEMETHYISMLTLVVPDYVPDAETPTFGFYHSGIYNNAKILPNSCETLPVGDYVVLKTENAALTQKQFNRYNIKDDGNSEYTDFVLRQNKDDDLESWFIKNSENGLKLTFAGYTNEHTTAEEFRVTFYKNHKLCKFNGGYSALDMTLEGGKIVEMDVDLEDVEAGDFIYCVASPLNINKKGVKSRSKMVLDSNGTFEDGNNSSKIESDNNNNSNIGNDNNNSIGINNSSDNNSSYNNNNSDNGDSSSSTPNISDGDKISSRLTPIFTIGDTIYFTAKEEILTLCSSKNGKDIDKKYPLENKQRITAHGEYISVLSTKESIMSTESKRTFILTLLDKELNVIKKAEINETQVGYGDWGNFDFDNDKIVYINHAKEIRCCDWDLGNERTLLSLPREDVKIAKYFEGITLADNYVAFKAEGTEGKTNREFYGVCDFSGKFEIHQKDDISVPSTSGDTTVWDDMHKSYGVKPSGEIVTYQNGRFQTLKTEDVFESQNVFLCDSDTIITTTDAKDLSDNMIRIYKNGKLVLKKPFDKDDVVLAIAKFGDDYIIKFNKPDKTIVVIWELT